MIGEWAWAALYFGIPFCAGIAYGVYRGLKKRNEK